MSLTIKELSELPSPFYRVSVKAIIFDSENRLLVGRGEEDDSKWEMPGGGWEHDESIEACLIREIEEELGIEVTEVGEPSFIYRGRSSRGWMILRVAVPVKIISHNFQYGEMSEAKFVTKEDMLKLDFAADEGTILDYVDKIWRTHG